MARGFRGAKRHLHVGMGEEKESVWVSYTDLMSAFLIILALVLMITMYNNQQRYEAQSEKLSQSAEAIKDKEAAIKKQNQIIEDVLGVKTRIIEELVKAFKDTHLNLQVDKQTGTIRFSGGVLFDKKSSVVSTTGQGYLKQFIPQYISILLSDKFRDEIAQIIVEGHTDTDGSYLYNLQLSQDRALSVVQSVFDPAFPHFKYQEQLKKVITANGRSFSVPIMDADGKINLDKSRRVEFKFRLKDEQVLDKLQGLMQPNG